MIALFTSFPRAIGGFAADRSWELGEGESNPVPDGTGKGYVSPSGLANRLLYNNQA